jgi:hypothetical protein
MPITPHQDGKVNKDCMFHLDLGYKACKGDNPRSDLEYKDCKAGKVLLDKACNSR